MGPIVSGLQSAEAPRPRRLGPVSDAPERRIWNTGKSASKGAGMLFLGSLVDPGHCFGETSRNRVASSFLLLIFCLLKTEGTDWISGFADEAHRGPCRARQEPSRKAKIQGETQASGFDTKATWKRQSAGLPRRCHETQGLSPLLT